MLIRIGATTRRRLLTTGVTAAALTTAGGMARPFIGHTDDRLVTRGRPSGVSTEPGRPSSTACVCWACRRRRAGSLPVGQGAGPGIRLSH